MRKTLVYVFYWGGIPRLRDFERYCCGSNSASQKYERKILCLSGFPLYLQFLKQSREQIRMNSSNIVVRGFFLSGAVSVNCYLLSFLQPLVVVFSCRQQRYYAASLLILATVSWRMDFESSPFHVENRRLITVLFTSSAAFSLCSFSQYQPATAEPQR